jgi:hypothetical protein
MSIMIAPAAATIQAVIVIITTITTTVIVLIITSSCYKWRASVKAPGNTQPFGMSVCPSTVCLASKKPREFLHTLLSTYNERKDRDDEDLKAGHLGHAPVSSERLIFKKAHWPHLSELAACRLECQHTWPVSSLATRETFDAHTGRIEAGG